VVTLNRRVREQGVGSPLEKSARGLCSLPGFYTDLASMTKPPRRFCPRSQPLPPAVVPRLTSQVQFLAPRLKGQVIDDPEPEPFR
jgi:hypothetical protein